MQHQSICVSPNSIKRSQKMIKVEKQWSEKKSSAWKQKQIFQIILTDVLWTKKFSSFAEWMELNLPGSLAGGLRMRQLGLHSCNILGFYGRTWPWSIWILWIMFVIARCSMNWKHTLLVIGQSECFRSFSMGLRSFLVCDFGQGESDATLADTLSQWTFKVFYIHRCWCF